jgi:MoxR-like ATPase
MSAIDRNVGKKEERAIIEAAEKAVAEIGKAKTAIASVIFGQEEVVERSLITLLSGGHGLLVGLPGLAKTKLVETLGIVLGLAEQRIQFTPDLMPSDILGSEILRTDLDGSRSFHFVKGPIFTQLLMADEINRASPRTQAALLQSMQEYHVTIAGKRYDLPAPFHVLATQNPLEQEGTYPLPEAQLDRFLMQIDVLYPSIDAERQILFETTGAGEAKAASVLTSKQLQEMQALVRRIPVGESVVNTILELVRSARPGGFSDEYDELIEWGPGPRASQALMLTSRARALLHGRLAPSVDDVLALAEPVLQHRMQVSFAARAREDKITVRDIISDRKGRIG